MAIDQNRDEEDQKELDALAEDVNVQAEDSFIPLPEWDAEKIERDFEVLEQTEDQF